MSTKITLWVVAIALWLMGFYLASGFIYAIYKGEFMNAYYAGGFTFFILIIAVFVTSGVRNL